MQSDKNCSHIPLDKVTINSPYMTQKKRSVCDSVTIFKPIKPLITRIYLTP